MLKLGLYLQEAKLSLG